MTSHVTFLLTSRCNLNCHYCFEKKRNLLLHSTPLALGNNNSSLQSIIDSNNISSVALTGGEPTLYPEFTELVEKLQHKDLTILSNAVERFRGSACLLENANIVISLDGNEAVMCKNRNINAKVFRSIMNNIDWYLSKAKSVTIHTVLTPHNINEETYFPFEQFGKAATYTIAVPSIIWTPDRFQIDPIQYKQAYNLIMYYEEKYNYHMKCSTNLISKSAYYSNNHNLIKEMIGLEYLNEYNCFRVFDSLYSTYEDAISAIPEKEKAIETTINNFLTNKPHNYLFDPYNLAESLLYNKITCTHSQLFKETE